jgi:Domain of unknown function (DUF1824)
MYWLGLAWILQESLAEKMNLGNNLTIKQAETILRQMSDLEVSDLAGQNSSQWQTLRDALLFLQQHSEFQIFGVCAPSAAIACLSLKAYLNAFEYESLGISFQDLPSDRPIYLKYNSRNQSLYHDIYVGKYEGVLVSYHSNFSEDYSGTHGYFPLDLWTGRE